MQTDVSIGPDSAPSCYLKRSERLLIVDRGVLLAEAIASAALVDGYGEARIAPDVPAVMRQLDKNPPTLLLVDLLMASENDFHLLEMLASACPQSHVVVMIDGRLDPQMAVNALMHGVDGVACRDQGISSLLRVLDLVRAGEMAVPRHLTGQLVKTLRQRPTRQPVKVQLSARQREVLRLLATGATDKDICEQLNISLTTVRSHLTAIFEKTETGNRTAAALWASAYFDQAAG